MANISGGLTLQPAPDQLRSNASTSGFGLPHARTRGVPAAELVSDGKVRINRTRVTKPSHTLRRDASTIAMRGNVKILKVLAPGHRRGPPQEARLLYEYPGGSPRLTPTAVPVEPWPNVTQVAAGPSKRDRRLTDRLTEQE